LILSFDVEVGADEANLIGWVHRAGRPIRFDRDSPMLGVTKLRSAKVAKIVEPNCSQGQP
jgi:hypothetical protein